MSAQIKWTITELECLQSAYGNASVVCNVLWSCNLREAIGQDSFDAVAIGKTIIEYDENSSFIPFDELTEDQVWQWVVKKVNKSEVEERLIAEIARQKAPPAQPCSPPWAIASQE